MTQRHVDTLSPAENPRGVKVLVVGLSRTGTMSMHFALKTLGYKSYHMSECAARAPDGHLIMWHEAIHAKYGPSPTIDPFCASESICAPYGAADFEKLLADYDALTDTPSVLFAPELMALYPSAKLILTTHPRGVDRWLQSIGNSYFRIGNWSVWDWPMKVYDDEFSRRYIAMLRRIVTIWTGNPSWPEARNFAANKERLRAFYGEHNGQIRALAKEQDRELLEFDPSMGYEGLCKFLGKDLPRDPSGELLGYPHINEGEMVVDLHKVAVKRRLWVMFRTRVYGGLCFITALGLAWWLY